MGSHYLIILAPTRLLVSRLLTYLGDMYPLLVLAFYIRPIVFPESQTFPILSNPTTKELLQKNPIMLHFVRKHLKWLNYLKLSDIKHKKLYNYDKILRNGLIIEDDCHLNLKKVKWL